jgi:hypothetical protein
MTDDLEAATDRVFAAMDDYRTGEAVHATRQVAKALARAALEGAPAKEISRDLATVQTFLLTLGEDDHERKVQSAANRIAGLEREVARLRGAANEGLYALRSARSYFLSKLGSTNPQREHAIEALVDALMVGTRFDGQPGQSN